MINKVKNYLNRKRKLVNFLSTHQDYLASGTYYTKRNSAYLFNCDKSQRFVRSLQENTITSSKKKVISSIKDIFDRQFDFKITSDIKSFNGTVLLLTWSLNLKIFDLGQQKVLTQCHSAKEYYQYKKTYKSVSTSFPIPKVYFFDDSQLLYVEEMVNFIPYNTWDNDTIDFAIASAFSIYISFFKENKNKAKPISLHLNKELINSYEFTKGLLENVTINSASVYMLHGDLWFDNMLFTNKKFYFIDWEYYREHFFFSDIINLFFVEALIRGDYTYINRFIQGEFDEKFKLLFLSTGSVYEPSLKKELLSLYLLERFCQKDHFKSAKEKQLMLRNYQEIFRNLAL
ncbi:hypothetical protein RJD24_02310 [Bacillaceae bacterium IKA-2]|nr:hypothetical protein RJD24_02310 [Bacillaceae bacterium IKA-2]